MKLFWLKIFAVLFCIVVVIFIQAQSPPPNPTPEQMEQWRREHEKTLEKKRNVEKQRNRIAREEAGVLQKLQQIELELAATQEELARYQNEIQQNQLKAEALQIEHEKLRNQDQHYKKLVARRIRALYKVGYNGRQFHTLKVLLGAQNVIDLLQKYKYLGFIAQADGVMLNQLQTRQQEILRTNLELAQQIQTIEAASKAAQAKWASMLAQKREREKFLHQYRTQKEIYEQTLEELRAAVVQLENLLGIVDEEHISKKAKEMKGFHTNLLGRLPWPVAGKIVPNQTTFDRGITIQAEEGTPVNCVADGIVARTVSSIVGYGNTILIAHGNGYISVYAHLSEILVKQGESVRAKQVIGKVGETGSLIGEALYFELWHNYDRLKTREWLTSQP